MRTQTQRDKFTLVSYPKCQFFLLYCKILPHGISGRADWQNKTARKYEHAEYPNFILGLYSWAAIKTASMSTYGCFVTFIYLYMLPCQLQFCVRVKANIVPMQ